MKIFGLETTRKSSHIIFFLLCGEGPLRSALLYGGPSLIASLLLSPGWPAQNRNRGPTIHWQPWGQPWTERAAQRRPARPLGPLVENSIWSRLTKEKWVRFKIKEKLCKIQVLPKRKQKLNMRYCSNIVFYVKIFYRTNCRIIFNCKYIPRIGETVTSGRRANYIVSCTTTRLDIQQLNYYIIASMLFSQRSTWYLFYELWQWWQFGKQVQRGSCMQIAELYNILVILVHTLQYRQWINKKTT